jgi:hypothetical protein
MSGEMVVNSRRTSLPLAAHPAKITAGVIATIRHKLQKGLLTGDQEPKEEMKSISTYITKLEV